MSNYKITGGQSLTIPLQFANSIAAANTLWWVYAHWNAESTGIVTLATSADPRGYNVAGVLDAAGNPSLTGLTVTIPTSAPAETSCVAEYYGTYGELRSAFFDVVAFLPIPAAPTGLTATSGQNDQVPLAWTATADTVTAYEIDRSATPGGSYRSVGTVGPAATSFTDYSAVNGTTYFYTVRGVNGKLGDGTPNYGPRSNEATATPVGLGGSTGAAVLWAAGSGTLPANAFAPAPLLIDGTPGDTATGYAGA